jgi:hypothetical protein
VVEEVAVAAEESQAVEDEENQAAVEDIKGITEILDRDINQMVAEAIQTKEAAAEAAAEVTEVEVVG